MLKKNHLLIIFSCLMAVACSSLKEMTAGMTTKKEAQPAATSKLILTEAPDVQALDVTSIPAGKCGMLLWTVDSGAPILVFRAITGESAEMTIDGVPAQLNLTRQSGETRYGFSSDLEYQSIAAPENQVKAGVKPLFGMPFEGGVYVESGLISLVNDQGWERVLPVAGLAGCRS